MEKIKTILSVDLKKALKEKDMIAIKAIRSLMSAIDNAGAVPVKTPESLPMSGQIAGATSGLGSTEVARRELSDYDIRQIIEAEINDITEAIKLINSHSPSEAKNLEEQIAILKKYL
jgi:uncharacterized protein YqeY